MSGSEQLLMQSTEPKTSIEVFISYAHEDQEIYKKLDEHLSVLKYSGKITIWQDKEIPAGEDWENQMHTHLNEADLILLLVSSSFIASNYCWNKEVQTALERHKARMGHVIPIILEPVDWQNTPLRELQALPTEAQPIMQWNDQDAAFDNVVQDICKVVEDLLETSREEAERKEKMRKHATPQQASQLVASPKPKTVASTFINKEAPSPLLSVLRITNAIVSPQKLTLVPSSSLQDPPKDVLPSITQEQHPAPVQPEHRDIVFYIILLSLILISIFIYIITPPDQKKALEIIWHTRTSSITQQLSGVAWSGSQFVAVGYSGTILTSTDGISWTSQTFDTSQDLFGIAWSRSQFVAVGRNGTILTSTDGISWISQISGTLYNLEGIASSGSQFVAVGRNGTILTSTDGISWTPQASRTSQDLFGIAWSRSQFVAVGSSGTILTSPDGISWTLRSSGSSQILNDIAWSSSQFVIVGNGGTILTSPDGINWASRTSGTPQAFFGIASSGSLLIAVGNDGTIFTSPDGISWTPQTSSTLQTFYSIASPGPQFVAVGTHGTILTSP